MENLNQRIFFSLLVACNTHGSRCSSKFWRSCCCSFVTSKSHSWMIRSRMKIPLRLWLLIFFLLCVTVSGAKKIDPYKVLGVEKNASQREIQKAFHKLSLQYHPDKNKNKGAQEKFSEINNAYEILSDEEKRKNYDLYGDEKGNPGFDSGHHNGDAGYSYFTNGGPGGNSFSFRPGDWQSSGGHGGSQSYQFSFGGQQNPFDFFGMNDMFGDLFRGGSQSGGPKGSSGGFRTSAGPNPGSKTPTKSSIKTVSSKVFKKEISDQGMTWLLMSYTPMMKDHKYYESLAEEVSKSLDGVLKVGGINCENEASLCEELRVYPRRAPRLFIYKPRDSLVVEYHGDLIVKDLKVFCQEHLPRFSKRVDHLKTLEATPTSGNDLPSVLLLSTQRDTPIIWRALSGLYHKRINFYDALVSDANDPKLKNFGVKSVPAIVGWLKNGERHILKSGISVKDKKSAIQELGKLLDDFERKNKKVANERKPDSDSARKQIPILTTSNIDSVCGEDVPVCIIGAFKSSRERDNIESVLSKVSQKSYSRKHALSYALLDANKETAFLKAFDAKSDKRLIAYKPRKGKFAAYVNGVMNEEGVESFISSVLNGDVQFSKTKQKPKLLS